MAMIKCPECGHAVSSIAPTCPECGVRIEGNIMKCPECGSLVILNQPQCPHCHYGFSKADQRPINGTPQHQPHPQHKSHTHVIILLIVTLILIGGACLAGYYLVLLPEQEEAAYQALDGLTEESAYENFLTQYPQSIHINEVQKQLMLIRQERAEWERTYSSPYASDFERFMRLYPESTHLNECQLHIDSLDWISAQQLATPEAMQQYLSQHPDGRFINEAVILKEQLEKTLRITTLSTDSLSTDTPTP